MARGRKSNRPVLYTPDQIQRYQAQFPRYQAGSKLKPYAVQQFQEGNETRFRYLFNSARSNLGYWEVTTSEESEEENLPLGEYYLGWYVIGKDGIPDPPLDLLGTGMENTVYAAEFSTVGGLVLRSSLPKGYPPQVRAIYSETEAGALLQTIQFREGSGPWYPRSQELDPTQWRNWTRFVFNLDGDRLVSDPIVAWRQKRVGDKLVNYTPRQSGYACTCPDFSKRQDGLLKSKWDSERLDRSWESSAAGSPGDCKHIIAAKIYNGEPVPVPADQPLPRTEKPKRPKPQGNYTRPTTPKKPKGPR